jgi:hypothetical protein
VELVVPTTDDSGIAKYLAKRGPGMRHLCLINEEPRTASDSKRYAFIYPEATGVSASRVIYLSATWGKLAVFRFVVENGFPKAFLFPLDGQSCFSGCLTSNECRGEPIAGGFAYHNLTTPVNC